MDKKRVYNLVIFKGVGAGLIVLLIFSILLAVFYSYIFTFSGAVLNKILLYVSLFLMIYTGFFIARRINSYGWLNGGLGGMIFTGIIILLGSFNFPVSFLTIMLLLLLGAGLGGIGGMIGVNFN